MRLIRKRGPRSTVAMFSVLALALAMTGVLYAHWTDQLDATVGIQTGTLDLTWGPSGTDDDGLPDGMWGIEDDDGLTWPQIYDGWLDGSSSDPAAPFSADRYDKDVGVCFIDFDPLNPELLWVNTFNAYPSYHCSLYSSVVNTESIPVKASFFDLIVHIDGVAIDPALVEYLAEGKVGVLNPLWDGVDDAFKYQVILDIAEGIRCGTQIDPGESMPVEGWFHVEQGATQETNYGFYMHQKFMNWNEWDASFCTPGAIVADAEGDPIGIANGTPDPDPLP